jgi:hypothetical protein
MKLTRENRSTRGKPCPSTTLSTTNPTWTDPRSNPGLRDGRPATNRLSHGTANWSVGSEEGKFMRTGLFEYAVRKEVEYLEWIFNSVDLLNWLWPNFYNVEMATLGGSFELSIGRAAWEAFSETFNLFSSTAFTLWGKRGNTIEITTN